jgi:protein-tyrosine phosphatase
MYEINFINLPGISGKIGLGRAPGYGSDTAAALREIKAQGISKIYCLQEEEELNYLNPGETVEKRRENLSALGIELVHSPIGDYSVPSKEQAEELSRMILEDVRSGKDILIHCMGGLGRSGTISACVLVRHGMSAEGAVGLVRRVRPGTLETDQQVEFVKKFKV